MQRWRQPTRCPVCSGELVVTSLRCDRCETRIEGEFEATRFSRLSREHLEFVEIFLRSRGNIKEVERALGVSYPTVRSRLDAVLEALGYRVEPAEAPEPGRADQARRKQILDDLNAGLITAEEAVRRLKST